MTHHAIQLPQQVELGAVKRLDYQTEIVSTDSGHEVRNSRWATPLRSYDISFPISRRDNAVYLAVLALYEQVEGGLHSFNFVDWSDETGGTIVPVRFDTPLTTTGAAPHLEHIETMTLVEVRL